jgi:hypothetical protein
MTLLEWCQRLESSPVGEWVTLSQYGFAILVAIHLLGLGLSAGTIMWMDFRLMGWILTDYAPTALYRRLAPWALAGFVLMVVSGVLLFVGYATAAYGNTYFRIKLVALLLAGVNAAVYHVVTGRRLASSPRGVLPFSARATGLISLTAWTVVILAGRMMSYTMF